MSGISTASNPRGSIWHRWDLHLHTPSSFDYLDMSITDQQFVDCLVRAGLRAVAITDHHTIDVVRIASLQRLSADRLTVFPGIELRDDHGGDPIHYICIFPEDCNLTDVWTRLQGQLNLTPAGIAEQGGDQRVYVPIEDGAKAVRALGGIVSIHAGAKSNSIESIRNKEQFQQAIKYDITRNHVDLLEIGQLKDIDRHLNVIFPKTGLDKPLVLCSDNHKITEYSPKAPLWIRADPTFRGLLMVLREPRERVYIGDRPPELIQVEQNRTKYIRRVSFKRRDTAPTAEQWFGGTIDFSSRLVAIVGNKGSGKSALSDMLGLLGATKNNGAFSFLSKTRFRHPTSGLAEHFEATLEWESGDSTTKCLDDPVKPEELERVKYLPQEHVETVCNELAGLGEVGFEQELKSVIFSHVPDAQRLSQSTLDDLVRFQTGEKQKRIDSLIKQLRDLSRNRALLEAQADPTAKRELIERINRRTLELEAHDKAKPPDLGIPTADAGAPAPDSALLTALSTAETTKSSLDEGIATEAEALRVAERRQAVARRLLEKLDNFEKEFGVFKASLGDDAKELGLAPDDLVAIQIERAKPIDFRDSAAAATAAARNKLNSLEPPGLRNQLVHIEAEIGQLQAKLDEPHRAYQSHLKELANWQTKRDILEGSEADPESMRGLNSSLAARGERHRLVNPSRGD